MRCSTLLVSRGGGGSDFALHSVALHFISLHCIEQTQNLTLLLIERMYDGRYLIRFKASQGYVAMAIPMEVAMETIKKQNKTSPDLIHHTKSSKSPKKRI